MTKKIEYPNLKKVGGLRNFIQNTFVKVIIIALISALVGGLSGYAVQNSFRNVTGYNKTEVTEEVQKENESLPIQELKNPYLNALNKSLIAVSSSIKSITESDLLQKANKASVGIIYFALEPVLKFLDKALFWLGFVIMFIISAWLTNKLINSKKILLSGGTDPQVVRNIEMLELKVKELVDNANNTNNK